jgi:hypothetical protein
VKAASPLLLALLLLPAALPAQWGFQADLPSRFIWRGFDLLPEDNPSFQPSATFAFGDSGFSVNLWGSMALDDRGELGEWDEIDLTLAYAFAPAAGLDAAAGFTNYGWWWADDFDWDGDTTQEVFASLRLAGAPLAPGLTVYYDFNLNTGLYATLDAGTAFKLSDSAELALNLALGYNSGFRIEGSGLSDATLSAALPVPVGRYKVTPFAKYSRILLDEVNDADYEAWGGVSLGF